MRLVIAGGGTGGHLFPGVAIAEEVKARDAGSQVLFVGTKRGIEARVLPGLGWPLALIDVSGLKTVGVLGALRGLLRIPRALLQSRRILARFAPDAVVGVGGYASGPVLLAAWLAGIPTAILEQNSIPGLANKILGRIVRRVFLAFEETRHFFRPAKIQLSGNPIRHQLRERLTVAAAAGSIAAGVEAPPPGAEAGSAAAAPFHLFCFGGSQGARAVSALMVEAATLLHRNGRRLAVVHQTGRDDREAVAARYRAAGIEADVRDFIDDMAREYGRADLVVARSGATTVAELTAIGRPALLVPYPFAADDHQTVNAQELGRAGAALVFPQAELDGPKLATAIGELIDDRARLARMSEAMRALGHPEAAGTIADWLEEQARGRRPAAPATGTADG